MIDYLKPLIWILLAVVAALALHAVFLLTTGTQPSGSSPEGGVPSGGGRSGSTNLTPTPEPTGQMVPPDPAGGQPSEPPAQPGPVVPPAGASGVDRIGLPQWEKALTQNGFAAKAHPTFHAGDSSFKSYVFSHAGVERAWAFLKTGDNNLVERLEFYVDGKEAVTPPEQPGAVAACNAIVLGCRSLDQALGDQIVPVLYSPYSSADAIQPTPNTPYKGFAKDVGHYIAIRLTPRSDMPGGQFLLLWKDPEKQVAKQNSIDFAAKCSDVKWDTFKAPAN